jgi:xanthine/CO dehydrogenase XdhC/CoxF family maturation factor
LKEIASILDTLDAGRASAESAVLATVVKVEGSAYRRPGARMLVTAHGSHVGTISGGCLEGDVAKQAWWLTASGNPVVCRYDTSADEDAQLTFGLGCNGVVHVLLEKLGSSGIDGQIELLRAVRATFRPGATAVVIASDGAVRVGERLVLLPDGTRRAGVCDSALADKIFLDLADSLRRGRSTWQTYTVAGSTVEVFLEHVPPPMRLVVFGAGHDAVPMVRQAKELGWHVTVADGRSHFARRERFPLADAVLVIDAENPVEKAGVTADSAVVVMTHSYEQDKRLLGRVLMFRPRYIGQLGPSRRTEQILLELAEENPGLVTQHVGALNYPVGLDIGADNPEEIALAVLAEIKAVWSGRTGGRLKAREGPIHDAATAA